MTLFNEADLVEVEKWARRRAAPIHVGDTSDVASTAGLLNHIGRPNTFNSGNVGVAVPLNGNPDSLVYIGLVGQ